MQKRHKIGKKCTLFGQNPMKKMLSKLRGKYEILNIYRQNTGLSSGSRKTRIETVLKSFVFETNIDCLSSGSRKTRIETSFSHSKASLAQEGLSSGSRKTRIETSTLPAS